VLARVSRLLRSPQVRENLLAATDAQAAFEVIARADAG
jgi:mannitol/fructose-specific phosphotransferase system IIA component (Ntr-type)